MMNWEKFDDKWQKVEGWFNRFFVPFLWVAGIFFTIYFIAGIINIIK